LVSGPDPVSATLSPGQVQVFSYTFSGSASGFTGFSSLVRATDANTGQNVTVLASVLGTVQVQNPPALLAQINGPSRPRHQPEAVP
jgi:hypothetical protein